MSRFAWNRHWTLIVALGACLAGAALFVRPVAADPVLISDDMGSGGGGGSALGDPDVPDGRSKSVKRHAVGQGNTHLGSQAAGDGRDSRSVTTWRLYVAWVGSRSFWFRY